MNSETQPKEKEKKKDCILALTDGSVAASSCISKGFRFDFGLGSYGSIDRCFSFILMFLSLHSSLSKVSKKISSG